MDERLDNDYITGAFKSYGPIFSHSSDQAISLFFGLLEDNQPEVYRMSGIFIKYVKKYIFSYISTSIYYIHILFNL